MIVNLFSPDGSARQPVPEQLRHDPAPGRAGAAAGRRRHHLPRPARLQHAALARSGEDGGAQPDGQRRGAAPSSSRTRRWRPGRSASRRSPTGQVFQYTMSTLGRLADAEQFGDMILKTDADGRHRPAARRGPHRAGRPGLRPDLHARRQAVGRAVDLSAARLQRPGDGRAGARPRWRS